MMQTLVVIIEYTIGRRVMSSFQVRVMVYLVSWDVSSLWLHHFDFNLHINYHFLGLCKYISFWIFACESILILCAFLKKIGVKECALGLYSIAKPKINLFLALIFHYVIWF